MNWKTRHWKSGTPLAEYPVPSRSIKESDARLRPLLPSGPLLFGVVLIFLTGCGDTPQSEFEKGAQQYLNRNPVDAVKHLRRAVALKPDYVPAYLLMGRIAAAEEDEQSAELNYRNAFDIVRRRDFKLTEEDIRAKGDTSLRLEWQEAANFLADAEFKNENYNRAQQYYDAILDHDPASAWIKQAYEGKQVAREFYNYKRTLAELRKQNYANPDDPRIQAEFSSLLMEMASALSRLRKLETVADFIAESNRWRQQATSKLEALYDASPEVRLPKTEALLAYIESQEALMRGHFDRSLEKAKEACEKDEDNAKYHFAVASILQVLETRDEEGADRTEEILRYAKEAVELDPKVWRYLVFYAGQLQELGQLQDSYKTLLKVKKVTQDEAVLREVDETLAALEQAISAEKEAFGGDEGGAGQ